MDLYLPPKPAIILPAEVRKQAFDESIKIVQGLGAAGAASVASLGGASVVSTVFAGVNNGAAANPVDFTTTGAVAAGDLVVVMFELESNAGTTAPWASGVTINGVALTRAVSANMTASSGAEIWYLANSGAIASGVTLRITPATSTFFKTACICATATRVATSSPLDVTSSGTGTSTSPTTTTGTLTQAATLCFGLVGGRGTASSVTEASGWTNVGGLQQTNTSNQANSAYKEVNATTAVTYAPTLGTSTTWGALIATFKKA